MKNPQIEIKDTSVLNKSITKDNGTVKDLRMQRALFHRGDGAIYPFDVMLGRNDLPYPIGFYHLASESYIPDRYGVGFRPTVGESIDTASKVKAA